MLDQCLSCFMLGSNLKLDLGGLLSSYDPELDSNCTNQPAFQFESGSFNGLAINMQDFYDRPDCNLGLE